MRALLRKAKEIYYDQYGYGENGDIVYRSRLNVIKKQLKQEEEQKKV